MFYFKSSEESSKFYNNSYQFTKEMSELLGRIEAGFGERLRHIDEGYSSIGKRFDDVIAQKGLAKEKLKEEESDVEAATEDRDKLISSLLERANISEEEKNKFKLELEEKEKQLLYASRQVLRYRSQLKELNKESDEHFQVSDHLEKCLKVVAQQIGPEHLLRAPRSWLSRRLKEQSPFLPDDVVMELRKNDITDSEGELTEKGRYILKRWSALNT